MLARTMRLIRHKADRLLDVADRYAWVLLIVAGLTVLAAATVETWRVLWGLP